MAGQKDLKPLMKRARAQGWVIDRTRNDRFKWTSPQGGTPVFSASNPSDPRAVRNLESMLKRQGLAV